MPKAKVDNSRLRSLLENSLLNPDKTSSLRDLPPSAEIKKVPLSVLVPNPLQPRKRFDDLDALAESVRKQGVIYPLLVRPLEDSRYEIIAGERRYRAAILAEVKTVPVFVKNVTESEARALALIENLQRQDLNPYEETIAIINLLACLFEMECQQVVKGLYRLYNHWNKSNHNVMVNLARGPLNGEANHNVMVSFTLEDVDEVFRELGRFTWQSFVQNRLPLLKLPDDIKAALENGEISYTAALALKSVDPSLRSELLEAAKNGMSIRELRRRIQEVKQIKSGSTPAEAYRPVIRKISRWAIPKEHEEEIRKLLDRLVELVELS